MFLMLVLSLACMILLLVFGFLVLSLVIIGWRRVISNRPKSYCHVNFDWTEPCLVGEPLSFRISLGKSRHHSLSDSITPHPTTKGPESAGFLRDVLVEIRQALVYHATQSPTKIEHVKEIDTRTGEVVVKFSVRNSGLYLISVSHQGVRAVGSPFRKRFKPCGIDACKTVFLRPSPTLLCIAGEEATHEVQPRDKYGNDCDEGIWINAEKSVESRLRFIPKFANCAEEEVSSDEVSHVFITRPDGSRIEIVLYVNKPGVYKGQILYDNKPINHGQFDILSITVPENIEMLQIVNNNPAWTPHQGNLLSIGGGEQVPSPKHRKVYLYVSQKLLYVQEYILKVIPFKLATYRVSPMTKIKMIRKDLCVKNGTDACWEYTFAISDGIQPQVTIQMETAKARIMLALYVTFLQKRLGGSENFEGKQRVFYQELRGSMKDLRITSKMIQVSRASLVYSSMNATKYFRKSDWCKNFGLQFEGENGYDYGGLRREWLELLCVQFFQNNPFGMFSSIGTSRLVHPNPVGVRYPLWTLKHYEFAGKIVGKCLFESSCGDVYTQMVKAKFSRSFLAQVLGIPPNYQHFENDDPELYLSKVKYILENDVTEDMELTFSEEEYDSNGRLKKVVELLPGGMKKKVTGDNKEQYLNALALYRLSSKVTKEIDAFKRGLTEIVPEELLTSFDENELELLLCGRSEFDIEDLKENLVRDWSWGGGTQTKLYSWFITAISNMNDDERGRLLQFTTGSSLLPHGGFKALNPKFKISISSEFGKLPKAHTCFNSIVLSDHDTYENFMRALITAITEGGEGFSFA